jgi:ribonuclease-3
VAGHVLDAALSGDAATDAEVQASITNFKSALQELAQSRHLPQPRYAIVKESGPEHSKTFTVEVRVGKELTGQGEGASKKTAAQRAARQVYQRLREEAAPA